MDLAPSKNRATSTRAARVVAGRLVFCPRGAGAGRGARLVQGALPFLVSSLMERWPCRVLWLVLRGALLPGTAMFSIYVLEDLENKSVVWYVFRAALIFSRNALRMPFQEVTT